MEGIGAAASIITILALATKVCNLCQEIKGADKDIHNLITEINNLKELLERLKVFVEDTNRAKLATTLDWIDVDGPLHTELEKVRQKLEPSSGAKWKWPFRQKEVAKIMATLERAKSSISMQLALNNVNISLENNQGVDEISTAMASERIETERQGILKWLFRVDPSTNHVTALEKHDPETGQWFLQSEQFNEWRSRPNSLLWLHGKAGCGKSILCSAIINQIQSHVQTETKSAIAYFYFDFNDSNKQTVTSLICSLSQQLCCQQQRIPSVLGDCYKKCLDGRHSPSEDDLRNILLASTVGFDRIYIIADAIDECPATGERDKLLQFIGEIHEYKFDSLHFLMTSRREIDIQEAVSPLMASPQDVPIDIQTDIVNKDIYRYIDKRLNSLDFKRWPAKLKQEVKDTLKEGADGMFRWAALHLDQLRTLPQPKLVSKSLRSLPKTLDGTYARMLMSVDPECHDQVFSALQLLAFSTRPLRLSELAEAVVIEPEEDPSFDRENELFEPSEILRLLSGLVTTFVLDKEDLDQSKFDQDDDMRMTEVRFAHYSVKEFVVSDRILDGPAKHFQVVETKAHSFIAKICLGCMIDAAAAREFPNAKSLFNVAFDTYLFLIYAVFNWSNHLAKIDNEPLRGRLRVLVCNFVRSNGDSLLNRARMAVLGHFGSPSKERSLRKGMRFDDREPIYESQLSSCAADFIRHSASKGLSELVALLLSLGLDADARDVDSGHDMFNSTSLILASANGHLRVMQLLLDKGANINAEGGIYGNALCAASVYGRQEAMQLLLDKGADINNHEGRYGTALHIVSMFGRQDAMQFLLDKGADVNAQGGRYGNALCAASAKGHRETMQLLLDSGADVNVQAGQYGNALCAASVYGRQEAMQLLLDKGADVNAQGGQYGNALCAASAKGRQEIMQSLLDRGADVNAQGGRYGNALCAASANGHQESMQLLLDTGADINAQEGEAGNALVAAIANRQVKAVIFLLAQGADINTKGPFGTALETAIHYQIEFLKSEELHSGLMDHDATGEKCTEIMELLESAVRTSLTV